jgi:CheY-like chemotaxis protein
MSRKLNCIMLIDDNPHDNFFHERTIKQNNINSVVLAKTSGREALEYLKSEKLPQSDLIFLDINMPGMNGWEFLKEYNQLDKELQSHAIIVMLTTSDNPNDMAKAKNWSFVSEYITKPLTEEMMSEISNKYFEQ